MKNCIGEDVEENKTIITGGSVNLQIYVEQFGLSTNTQKAQNYNCRNIVIVALFVKTKERK